MKAGDLVRMRPECFDEPWSDGIILRTVKDEENSKLTLHLVHWTSNMWEGWTEEGFLETVVEK